MITEKLTQLAWSLYGRFAWDQNRSSDTLDLGQRIVDILSSKKEGESEHVWDVGCGTGYYSYQLAKAGFSVTGIDYAKGMLDVAKANYQGIPNLVFKQMDVSKILPVKSGTVSHVICVSSIQALPDPLFSLKELNRIMKAGGSLIITHTSSRRSPQDSHMMGAKSTFLSKGLLSIKSYVEKKGFTTYWTKEELTSMIQICGFEIVKVEILSERMIIIGQKKNSL
ncbi:MAG: class I SAM-dependent methyltransferase [Bacteroidota bacterium]